MALPESLYRPVRARVDSPRRGDGTTPEVQDGETVQLDLPAEADVTGDVRVRRPDGNWTWVHADCLTIVDGEPWWAADVPIGRDWERLTQTALDARVGALLSQANAYELAASIARGVADDAEDAANRADDSVRGQQSQLTVLLQFVAEHRPDLTIRSYWK